MGMAGCFTGTILLFFYVSMGFHFFFFLVELVFPHEGIWRYDVIVWEKYLVEHNRLPLVDSQ